MRRLFTFFLLSLTLLFPSCKWYGTAGEGNIQLEAHSILFGADGGSKTVDATKSGFWITGLSIWNDDTLLSIIPESHDVVRGEWITASRVSNATETASLFIEVLPNDTGEKRFAVVSVSYMDYSESVEIVQESNL